MSKARKLIENQYVGCEEFCIFINQDLTCSLEKVTTSDYLENLY